MRTTDTLMNFFLMITLLMGMIQHAEASSQTLPTSRPLPSPGMYIVRLCNGDIGFVGQKPGSMVPKLMKDSQNLCVPLNYFPAINVYSPASLKPLLNSKIQALQTRIRAALTEIKQYPESLIDLVDLSLGDENYKGTPFRFDIALSKLHMSTETISFYLNMSHKVYYLGDSQSETSGQVKQFYKYIEQLEQQIDKMKTSLINYETQLKNTKISPKQREYFSQRKIKLNQDISSKELVLSFAQDPSFKQVWSLLVENDSFGFNPWAIMYRNVQINPKTKAQDNKDVSGVFFAKREESKQNTPPLDELLIVFVGSRSLGDWKYNINFLKNKGLGKFDLLPDYRIHQGILNALEQSLKDAGIKINIWLRNYIQDRRNDVGSKKPTLRVTVTGHSLGAAMADLMGIFIKENFEKVLKDIANLEVRVVTFGAPAVLDQASAQKAENLIGKQNILRFWTLKDPVASLIASPLDIKGGIQSPLASLLGFFHIGTSIPLFTQQELKDTKRGRLLDLWDPHLPNSYKAILSNPDHPDWPGQINQVLTNIRNLMTARKIFQSQDMLQNLNQISNFMDMSSDWLNHLVKFSKKDLDYVLQKSTDTKTPLPSTIANYETLQESRYEQGREDPLKFKKVDLSHETDKITYQQTIAGKTKSLTIDRSTSCTSESLAKQFGFQHDQTNQPLLSCTCCIVKNTFVSYGAGNIFQKARDFLTRKNVKTPFNILDYCQQNKHCSDPKTKNDLFPASQDLIVSFGKLMESIGLLNVWKSKKVE